MTKCKCKCKCKELELGPSLESIMPRRLLDNMGNTAVPHFDRRPASPQHDANGGALVERTVILTHHSLAPEHLQLGWLAMPSPGQRVPPSPLSGVAHSLAQRRQVHQDRCDEEA